jgi:hypothetical protein
MSTLQPLNGRRLLPFEQFIYNGNKMNKHIANFGVNWYKKLSVADIKHRALILTRRISVLWDLG